MTAPRVAIVGGGIAGLSIAHALASAAPGADVVVFEAGNRQAGIIGIAGLEWAPAG